jgi:hypothetical protein
MQPLRDVLNQTTRVRVLDGATENRQKAERRTEEKKGMRDGMKKREKWSRPVRIVHSQVRQRTVPPDLQGKMVEQVQIQTATSLRKNSVSMDENIINKRLEIIQFFDRNGSDPESSKNGDNIQENNPLWLFKFTTGDEDGKKCE